jgi:hypothetical protein
MSKKDSLIGSTFNGLGNGPVGRRGRVGEKVPYSKLDAICFADPYPHHFLGSEMV